LQFFENIWEQMTTTVEENIFFEELTGRPAYGCGWILALLESVKATAPDRVLYPAMAASPASYFDALLNKPEVRHIELQVALLKKQIDPLPLQLDAQGQAAFWMGYWKHIRKIEQPLRIPNEDYQGLLEVIRSKKVHQVICQRAMHLPRSRLLERRYRLDDTHSTLIRIQIDSVVEQMVRYGGFDLQSLLRAAVHEEVVVRLNLDQVYYIKFDSFWQNSPDWFAGPFPSREQADSALHRALDHPESQVVQANEEGGFIDVRNAIRVYKAMPREEALEDGLREAGQRGYNIVPYLPLSRDDLVTRLQGERTDEKS
jgi:hypothetical protein